MEPGNLLLPFLRQVPAERLSPTHMDRSLEPELLDSLPPDHPDALHNRRDIRLTNRAMGNHAWFARVLPTVVRPGERILEIGAGTGELIRRLAENGLAADGLDLWPPPPGWPADRVWHQADLRTFSRWAEYPVVVANLILHQFADAELRALGSALRHARVIAAREPARSRVSQVAYRCFAPIIGANHVSLHDAHVSIAAGFVGDELPRVLGLDAAAWDIQSGPAFLGAYVLLAVRRTP